MTETHDGRQRDPHIDLIKAVFALAVVMVHCMRPGWDGSATRFEIWFGSALAILVTPAFLFCAGFLAAHSEPISGALLVRRYRRLLAPYLVATLMAEAYHMALPEAPPRPGGVLHNLIHDLLLADAFGPYYFVFHMLLLTPVGVFLSRMPVRARQALWVVFLVAGAVRSVDVWIKWPGLEPQLGVFMLVRNPFIYWGFYLSGWEFRLAERTVRNFLDRRREVLLPLAMTTVTGGAVEAWFTPGWQTPWLSYPLIYGVLLALLLSPVARPGSGGQKLVRWLSERTYSFYLFHLFFVLTALRFLPHPPGDFALARFVCHYAAGVVGVTLVVLGRERLAAIVPRQRTQ
ncbi:MAG: acyltransferase [Myxococcales bacterium]|nr:acyltransferase [Myxococcales bacterium]MDD9968814.1 acyltransferase [Myxococcales bacterium]